MAVLRKDVLQEVATLGVGLLGLCVLLSFFLEPRIVFAFVATSCSGAIISTYLFAAERALRLDKRRSQLRRAGRHDAKKRSHRLGLRAVRWFFYKSRDELDLALADIERDRKDMRSEGRSDRFIRWAVRWLQLRVVVPIMWDSIKQLVAEITPFGTWVRKLTRGG